MQIRPCNSQPDGADRAGDHPVSPAAEYAFTLAEVIVSVLVLTIMAVSLYAGFSTGFMIVDSAREDLRATQILMQKAEAIRLCTWSSLSNCPLSFVERYDPAGSANGTNSGGTMFCGVVSTNVATPIPDSSGYKTNMCLATITLNWTNFYGKQPVAHSRQLQTLVSQYGIQNYIWGRGP